MRSANQVKFILPQKLRYYVTSEHVAYSSLWFAPHFHVWFRVSPKQITKQTSVGNISRSDDFVDLIDSSKIGGQSTVHTQDFVLNYGGNRHAVEAVDEGFP